MSIRTEAKIFEDATVRIFIEKRYMEIRTALNSEDKTTAIVVGFVLDGKYGSVPLTDNAYGQLLKLLNIKEEKVRELFKESKDKFLDFINRKLTDSKFNGFVLVMRNGVVVGILKNDKTIIPLTEVVNALLDNAEIIDYKIGNLDQLILLKKGYTKYCVFNSDCGLWNLTIFKNPVFDKDFNVVNFEKVYELTDKRNLYGFISGVFKGEDLCDMFLKS